MTAQSFDQAKANGFAKTMIVVLGHVTPSLMSSRGHRIGMFNTLANMVGRTSTNNIEYNPTDKTYTLPLKDAACLRHVNIPNKISVFSQYISLLGTVEGEIIAFSQTIAKSLTPQINAFIRSWPESILRP